MLLSWEYGISEDRKKQLEAGTLTPEDAIAGKIASLTRYVTRCDRWIAHYSNRLAYTANIKVPAKLKVQPQCRTLTMPIDDE